MKKTAAIILAATMAAVSLFGCGQTGDKQPETAKETTKENVTETTAKTENTQETAAESEAAGAIPKDITATLRLSGPGLFTSVGEDGSVDLVTGAQKPGYKEVIARWNEIYPNVKIEVETAPWDNWTAALQTAALSGQVDILLHGASVTAVAEPLDSYLEKEPELKSAVSMLAVRKNENVASYSDFVTYGMSVTVNPVVAVIDKSILEHYGVEMPDKSWTLEDMKTIAEKCTGTDPVTGKKTYGISMIKSSQTEKNYIWAGRAMNNPVFEYKDKIKDCTVNFNTDKTKEVLDYVAGFYQYSNPDYVEGLDLGNAYKEENDLAMIIVEEPFNSYNQIKVSGLEDRFMFLQLPAITGGEYDGISASHMGDWNMAICNTSTQKDLAWEFIKFMVTDEVVQDWIVRTCGIPSNIKGGANLANAMPKQYYEAINDTIQNFPSDFSLQANDSYNSIDFGSFSSDIGTVLNEMYMGNMTADQAAEKVQANVDEFMKTKQN